MHCRLLTQYAIIMVQFLAGLRKIKLRAAVPKDYEIYFSPFNSSVMGQCGNLNNNTLSHHLVGTLTSH